MAFLLDTNVLSELRKKRRNEPKVQAWLGSVDSEGLFTSVIAVGEIRRGIEKIRPTDPVFASQLELWLRRLQLDYQDRILHQNGVVACFDFVADLGSRPGPGLAPVRQIDANPILDTRR